MLELTSTDVVQTARELRPLIGRLADQIEQKRCLPDELLAPMHDAGMFRMFLPREAGGLELDPWTAFEVTERLAMEDASTGWLAMITSLSSWAAAYLPLDVAREVYAGEHDVLAGSVLGESEARVVEGGIMLSGRFHFASGCLHATWLAAIVADPRHEGPEPAPRLAAVIPAGECSIVDVWRTTGLRGTSSNDWTVQDVFVPWERTFRFLPEAGASFASGPLYRWGLLGIPGVAHHGVDLGAARGAIDGLLDRIEQRQRRGTPLKLEPEVQIAVGKAEALVASARAHLKEQADDIWVTVCDGREPSLEQLARLRLAKTLAASNAVEAVDLVYEAMGSQAIMDNNPVERRFRDVHATGAHLQSSKLGFRVAGSALLGVDPRPTPLL